MRVNRWGKRWLAPLLAWFAVVVSLSPFAGPAAAEAGPAVYVVPVESTIEQGLQSYLERAYKDAEEAEAERIILVISTPGGRVDSAEQIGKLIRESDVPTTVFVEDMAVSAGTYIALNAEHIVMKPNSMIGAAAVVDGSGTLIDNPKTISYWTTKMTEAAKLNGRNPNIAAKMVDVNVVLDEKTDGIAKGKGEILSLGAEDALKVGYADHIAGSVDETLQWLKLGDRNVIHFEMTAAEKLARWLVQPAVMTILLIFGIAGLAIELLVPGFGVPGIVGLAAFILYFFGHYVAGFAGLEAVVLFVVGIVLLILEIFVPSFGILGTLGSLSLVGGVVMAAPDAVKALVSLALAFIIAIVIIFWFAKRNNKRGVWNRFILRDALTVEEGYIPAPSLDWLAGKSGVTLTPLRPAGTVEIDGERFDVVTAGEFIQAGKTVKVVKVEGVRVVVREEV